jgi:hypothetical protein
LGIGQPDIPLPSFQLAFGRFVRRKGCLSATEAFKRSEAERFHANGIDDCSSVAKKVLFLQIETAQQTRAGVAALEPAGSCGMQERPQKITFAEMRSAGVHGVLIYCADYKCVTPSPPWRTDGVMTCGFRISSRGLSAQLAASEAPMCDRISTGTGKPRSLGVIK